MYVHMYVYVYICIYHVLAYIHIYIRIPKSMILAAARTCPYMAAKCNGR